VPPPKPGIVVNGRERARITDIGSALGCKISGERSRATERSSNCADESVVERAAIKLAGLYNM